MKFFYVKVLLVALLVLLSAAFFLRPAMKVSGAPGAPTKAVVVELFTSEGCSSCPPADELLGHLRQDLAGKNIQVIPLGFHVDYWNSLGWKDRFSSADFSHRQELYARTLGVDGPYTPQMVVDGAHEFVGNSSGEAQRAVRYAANQPEIAVVKISAAGADQLQVQVNAPASAGDAGVLLALTEDNLTTKVGSGENGGRTLRHSAVVRELRQLGQLHDGSFVATVPIKVEKEWKREDLRAVVFVQEVPSGKIQGAASVALVGQPH
jgi:hypothetical protein